MHRRGAGSGAAAGAGLALPRGLPAAAPPGPGSLRALQPPGTSASPPKPCARRLGAAGLATRSEQRAKQAREGCSSAPSELAKERGAGEGRRAQGEPLTSTPRGLAAAPDPSFSPPRALRGRLPPAAGPAGGTGGGGRGGGRCWTRREPPAAGPRRPHASFRPCCPPGTGPEPAPPRPRRPGHRSRQRPPALKRAALPSEGC